MNKMSTDRQLLSWITKLDKLGSDGGPVDRLADKLMEIRLELRRQAADVITGGPGPTLGIAPWRESRRLDVASDQVAVAESLLRSLNDLLALAAANLGHQRSELEYVAKFGKAPEEKKQVITP